MGLVTTTILVKFLAFLGHPLVELILIVISNVAVAMIIVKAGYSRWWLWIPVLPSALAVSIYVWSHYFAASIVDNSAAPTLFQVLLFAEVLMFVVAWIFMLLFALSRWPVSVGLKRVSRIKSLRSGVIFRGVRGVRGGSTSSFQPSTFAVSPSFNPAKRRTNQELAPVRTVYCAMCGAPLAEGSEFFHECRDEEALNGFCRTCGTPRASDGQCAVCASPPPSP